jgi:hypothetical protein
MGRHPMTRETRFTAANSASPGSADQGQALTQFKIERLDRAAGR